MRNLPKALNAAISVAIMTAIVWYFVNQFDRVKGQGILERQPWPINDIYLCAGIASLLAVIGSGLTDLTAGRRQQAMEAAAAQQGFAYQQPRPTRTLGKMRNMGGVAPGPVFCDDSCATSGSSELPPDTGQHDVRTAPGC